MYFTPLKKPTKKNMCPDRQSRASDLHLNDGNDQMGDTCFVYWVATRGRLRMNVMEGVTNDGDRLAPSKEQVAVKLCRLKHKEQDICIILLYFIVEHL